MLLKNRWGFLGASIVLGLTSAASATKYPKPKLAVNPFHICIVNTDCSSPALVNTAKTVCPTPVKGGPQDTCTYGDDQSVTLTKHFPVPAGMSIDGSGNLTGTPTEIHNTPFKFNVCMHDSTHVADVCKPTSIYVMGPRTLTVKTTLGGSVAATSDLHSNSSCAAATVYPFEYTYNTSVTLTASPESPYAFTGWSGGGCKGTGACTLPATSTVTVKATFTRPTIADPNNVGDFGLCIPSCTSKASQDECSVKDPVFLDNDALTTLAPALSQLGISWSRLCSLIKKEFLLGAHEVTFTSNGNFAVPSSVTSITVEIWGGGGSGRSGSTLEFGQGGRSQGGGSGGYDKQTFSVAAGSIFTVVVGAAGSGDGVAGGTSSFGTLISATGGGGGVFFWECIGQCLNGGSSSDPLYGCSWDGAGTGWFKEFPNGGDGGSSCNGGLGGIGSVSGNGAPGKAPGGGGAGGAGGPSPGSGGAGAPGKVIVSW